MTGSGMLGTAAETDGFAPGAASVDILFAPVKNVSGTFFWPSEFPYVQRNPSAAVNKSTRFLIRCRRSEGSPTAVSIRCTINAHWQTNKEGISHDNLSHYV
jgi:hypothetical protein